MGKSRLVAEFVRIARRRGLFVAFGECQSFGDEHALLRLARDLARRSLASTTATVERGSAPPSRRPRGDRSRARRARAAARDRRRPRRSRTTTLTAAVRREAAQGLARGPARRRCLAARAGDEPLVIVLEDCHWIDELSRDLLEVLVRATADAAGAASSSPIGRRRRSAAAWASSASPQFGEIALDAAGRRRDAPAHPLEARASSTRRRAARRPGRARRRSSPSAPRATRSTSRSCSSTSSAQRHRPGRRAGAPRRSSCPDSLHSLVLGRIDYARRGAAPDAKVASVVGRVFEAPVLPRRLPGARRRSTTVREHLDDLRGRGPRHASTGRPNRPTCSSTSLTQEVAYESLPFALRADAPRAGRRLHRGDGRRTRSSASSTCSPTTTGSATTRPRSACTSGARPTPPRPRTPTPPRSTTSSG